MEVAGFGIVGQRVGDGVRKLMCARYFSGDRVGEKIFEPAQIFFFTARRSRSRSAELADNQWNCVDRIVRPEGPELVAGFDVSS